MTLRFLRLLFIGLLSINQLAWSAPLCYGIHSSPVEPPPKFREMAQFQKRMGVMARDGKLLNQNDSRLAERHLILNEQGAGLCATTCAVNILMAAANPYLKTTPSLDPISLAADFIKAAQPYNTVDVRISFPIEKIKAPLETMGRQLGLTLNVEAQELGTDVQSFSVADIYSYQPNEMFLISIWTAIGNHAVVLSSLDPISRRAKYIDPNFPEKEIETTVLPVRFDNSITEKLETKQYPGIPPHPLNGSIIKVVRVRDLSGRPHLDPTQYKVAQVKTLGGPRSSQ